MAQDETTRTPTAQDGDAAEHTPTAAPTPTDERTDQPAADKAQRDALANKLKAEQMNQLLEQTGASSFEELAERVTQSPAAIAPTRPQPQATDDYEQVRADRQHKIVLLRAKAKEYEAQGDQLAALVLDQETRLLQQEQRLDDLAQGTADAFVLTGIQDPKKRDRIAAHYEKNKHRLGDIKAAAAEVAAADLARENKELRDKLAAHERPRDPDVVNAPSFGGREITATERTNPKKMTGSELNARVAALEADGKHMAAVALKQQARDGVFEVDYAR